MNIESLRNYCLSKEGATESFPFGESTLVFKVHGKMFALFGLNDVPLRTNLKCNPEWAVELREHYDGTIIPGYHMNKKHWNTVYVEKLPNELVRKMIDHSYSLVVKKSIKNKKMR